MARGREAKCTDPGIAELLPTLARVPVKRARAQAARRTCGGFTPCQSHHMDRMDHGPLRKKSARARGGLAERFRKGTERVHGPQQARFARSRKALRRGAGGTSRPVRPRVRSVIPSSQRKLGSGSVARNDGVGQCFRITEQAFSGGSKQPRRHDWVKRFEYESGRLRRPQNHPLKYLSGPSQQ